MGEGITTNGEGGEVKLLQMNFIERYLLEREIVKGAKAMFGANWKTSLGGLGSILTGIAGILHSLATGTPVNWQVDIAAIVAGFGLLFAKDHDVTGGTKPQ